MAAHGFGREPRHQTPAGQQAGGQHRFQKVYRARECKETEAYDDYVKANCSEGDRLQNIEGFADAAEMPPSAMEIEKAQGTQADCYEDRRGPHQQMPKRQAEVKP